MFAPFTPERKGKPGESFNFVSLERGHAAIRGAKSLLMIIRTRPKCVCSSSRLRPNTNKKSLIEENLFLNDLSVLFSFGEG